MENDSQVFLCDPVFSFVVRRPKLLRKATHSYNRNRIAIDDIFDQGGVHPFMGFHKIKYDSWFHTPNEASTSTTWYRKTNKCCGYHFIGVK